ncbi:MAG: hypothetical protein KatS3mg014_2667 [Actinomycetota bacterium]|nr:MAG: hypothetical protein KatS3mg014_2667 [Actinomycetota bacterium]
MDTGEVVADGRFGIGDTVTGRLTDSDKNIDPLVRETTTITIVSSVDTVTLVVTEETTSSPVFRNETGVLVVVRSNASPDTSDTILEVVAGETIAVRYNDPIDPNDTQAIFLQVFPTQTPSTAILSKTKNLAVSASSFFLGETIYAFVLDTGANRDSTVRDTIVATLLAVGTNDSVSILLTETAAASGVFAHETGILLDTAFLPVSGADSVLEALFGDTVQLSYTDAFDASDSVTLDLPVLPANPETKAVTISVTTSSGGSAVTAFTIGETLFVRIAYSSAAGLPFDPNAPDSFLLQVYSAVTGDTETTVLTESGDATLVFTNDTPSGSFLGPVPTAMTDGTVTPGDGVLELSPVGRTAFTGAGLSAQGAYAAQQAADQQDEICFEVDGQIICVPVQAQAVTSAAAVVAYPNPYRPNDGDPATGRPFSPGDFRTGILFSPMPSTWRLRIFSLDGRLVADRRSEIEAGRGRIQGGTIYQYDAANDAGTPIASGIYLWVLESNVGTKTGKLAVIR